MKKSALKSKTLWFNIVTLALAGTQTLLTQDIIPPEFIALIIALGNVALRYLTSKPII